MSGVLRLLFIVLVLMLVSCVIEITTVFCVCYLFLVPFSLCAEHKEKEKLETDAMFKLDHRGKDKEKLKRALPSLSEIQEYQSGWKDDFQLNSALRRNFRV